MPTITEQIAANNNKLDQLLAAADKTTDPATEQMVTLAEALNLISAELNKGNVAKERAEYLKEKLAEVQKALFFEANAQPSISIKVINDPLNIQPATATGNLATVADNIPKPDNQSDNRRTIAADGIPSAPAVTNFSSTGISKAQAIQKLLVSKDALAKSKLTDKLDDIKEMFSINDEDLKGDGYDLRWKVGDLIQLLVNAIKLEKLTGTDITEKSAGSKPTPTAKAVDWPHDLASAKFDDKEGVFKNEPGRWGRDERQS